MPGDGVITAGQPVVVQPVEAGEAHLARGALSLFDTISSTVRRRSALDRAATQGPELVIAGDSTP